MSEALQAMLDRMVLEDRDSGAGADSVSDIAVALKDRLKLATITDEQYKMLAEQMVKMSIKNNSSSASEGSNIKSNPTVKEKGGGAPENKDHPTANLFVTSPNNTVQGTWSTEASTSPEDNRSSSSNSSAGLAAGNLASFGAHQAQQPQQPSTQGSYPFSTESTREHSPLRPPPPSAGTANSPSRRPRPSSRSGSTRKARRSPFHLRPSSVGRNNNVYNNNDSPINGNASDDTANFEAFGTNVFAHPTVAGTSNFGSTKTNASSSHPKANLRASSPQPTQTASPAKPPPSPSRPGLQEGMDVGIAESPRTKQYSSTSVRPTPRREDNGAGAVNAAPPRNFSPMQNRKFVYDSVDVASTAAMPTKAGITPKAACGGPEPMSTTPMGELFTPPPSQDFASAAFATSVLDNPTAGKEDEQAPFKTGEHKNRRKGGITPRFESTNGFAAMDPPASQEGAASTTATQTFAPPPLTQPSLSRNPDLFQLGTHPTRRNSRKHPHTRNPKPASPTEPMDVESSKTDVSGGCGGSPTTKETDPLPPSSNAGSSLSAAFSMGTAPSVLRGTHRNLGTAKRSISNAGVNRSREETAQPKSSLTQQQEELHDIQEQISKIREKAKQHYTNKEYKESIWVYTQAIDLLSAHRALPLLQDLLAVLYSNRAGAFMMISAYEQSQQDCDQGLPLVSDDLSTSFSNDSGAPLKVRLLLRRGRASLNLGILEEATKDFETACLRAKEVIEHINTRHTSGEQDGYKKQLEQMITDAGVAMADCNRLRDIMRNYMKVKDLQGHPDARTRWKEALQDFRIAEPIAPGSLDFRLAKVDLLSKLGEWRRMVGYIERIAAENSKAGGVFVGNLAKMTTLPVQTAPTYLKADFFKSKRDEDPTTFKLKLSTKAAAEAVYFLPLQVIRTYIRSLRLEEMYPTAQAVINTLMSYRDSSGARVIDTQDSFSWLGVEQDKLTSTKDARETADELFRTGDFELACATYSKALSIDSQGELDLTDGPNAGGRLHAVLHCNIAACLMALRRHQDALKECNKALKIHPCYMKAMLRKARCFSQLNRFHEGISEYQRYIKLVEDARRLPRNSQDFVTTCIFETPLDVKDKTLDEARGELKKLLDSKRAKEAKEREAANRGRHREPYRPQWNRPQANGFRSQFAGSQARNQSRSSSFRSRNPDPLGFYKALQIETNATADEVKKSYRKLCLRYHPDKNGTDDPDIFINIQNAYGVLSCPEKRQHYDLRGTAP